MRLIDAHAHLPADHPDVQLLLRELGVQVLNISLGFDAGGQWRRQPMSGVQPYQRLAQEHPQHFAWCTAFDPPHISDLAKPGDYVERILAQLALEFADGAIACKVWKNVGLEVRSSEGRCLLIDDPLFSPIFEFIAREERTLILHTGEPRACFLPLDPANPHYDYYREHPQWHMYGRVGYPSHTELIASRDRVLERYPSLRVVGAHLGSLEYDVSEIDERLRRFPNFCVDTAERLPDLALQPTERVRTFFEVHAGRILFGSDLLYETAFSAMLAPQRELALAEVRRIFTEEQAFYRETGSRQVRGREVQGLGLSEAAQQQLFEGSARSCYAFR